VRPTQAALKVVTVQTGQRYPDLWVSRLAAMVGRNLSEAHRFIVYTDRPEPTRFDWPSTGHQQLEVRDLQGGGLKGFFSKLKLFDQGLTGRDPFLYLDNTLVIRSNLGPLVELGRTIGALVPSRCPHPGSLAVLAAGPLRGCSLPGRPELHL
jgi:hypothetical protein